MEEPKRTLAYICPKCKQTVVVERPVFRLAAAPDKLPCPCGGSALKIEMEADHVDLTVPCAYCGESAAAPTPFCTRRRWPSPVELLALTASMWGRRSRSSGPSAVWREPPPRWRKSPGRRELSSMRPS